MKITGGVVPWMIGFIEKMTQSYLIDFILQKLETEIKTTWQDEINNLAMKYIKPFYLSNGLGFDFSLAQKPVDTNDRFEIDLNGTFLSMSPGGSAASDDKQYMTESRTRFNNSQISDIMNMDIVAVAKIDMI